MRQAFELNKVDIQGLAASGYGHLDYAAYVLLRVEDPGRVKGWLLAHIPEITRATGLQSDSTHLNLAVTAGGLPRLGLSGEALRRFPIAFQEGMVAPHRSRALGDTVDALRQWRWGTAETAVPDLLLLVYGSDEAALLGRLAHLLNDESGLQVLAVLRTDYRLGNTEHFGFADGIGQPAIEGFEEQYLSQLRRTGHAVSLMPGEFLLGYTNELGTITEEANAFGRNGTYLVFRQMEQHVDEFWKYFWGEARGDESAAIRLAAKAIGRWRSGAPLTLTPDEDDTSLCNADDFSYADDDPDGFRCPIGAHIRRANPRDSLEKNLEDAMRRTRRRRLLRRGRSYTADDGSGERGLHFICLCGDIERQFEFVQQTWIDNPAFAGLLGETDPLTGTRPDSGLGRFTIQRDPVRTRLAGLPRFVAVRGGGYFFLPGVQALKDLAGM